MKEYIDGCILSKHSYEGKKLNPYIYCVTFHGSHSSDIYGVTNGMKV